MFGGNPGRSKSGQMRLDDLWKLSVSAINWCLIIMMTTNIQLHQLTRETLYKECRYKLRQTRLDHTVLVSTVLLQHTRYHELACSEPSRALHYLQTAISEITDHSNTQQSQQFRSLAASLFTAADNSDTSTRDIREKVQRVTCVALITDLITAV